jgi:hypothetical protein
VSAPGIQANSSVASLVSGVSSARTCGTPFRRWLTLVDVVRLGRPERVLTSWRRPDLRTSAPSASPDRCRLLRWPVGVKSGRRPSACRRAALLTRPDAVDNSAFGGCSLGGWSSWTSTAVDPSCRGQAAKRRGSDRPVPHRTSPKLAIVTAPTKCSRSF